MVAKKSSGINVFHPILFGLYPVLFLMSVNIGEIPFQQSWRSLIIALSVSVILWILLRLVLKDNQKAALVTSVLVIAFFVYGHLYNFLGQDSLLNGALRRHRYIIPFYISIILVSIWWVVKKARDLKTTTQIFNLMGLGLIILPVFQIGSFEIRTLSQNETASTTLATLNAAELPDIYYIILDAYSRSDVLYQRFAYDNSAFVDQLRNLGFYVADCSSSNYGKTTMSLATSLNMEYLENLGGNDLENKATGRVDLVKFIDLINNNAVRKNLEANGYTIVGFQTGFNWTEWKDADYFFAYSNQTSKNPLRVVFAPVNQFESLLIETSAGILYNNLLNKFDINYETAPEGNPETVTDLASRQIHYNIVSYTLDTLGEIPASVESPKFVFAHIVSPHKPFVFGPEGEFTPDQNRVNPGYLDQITYLNQRTIAIVEKILQSEEKPIVIIQGDHGAPGTEHSPARMPILNAYYLPGDGNEKLYNTITPVNSFRLLFDYYFNTQYGLLEDISRNSEDREPFNFTIIPNSCD